MQVLDKLHDLLLGPRQPRHVLKPENERERERERDKERER
jgi:hypothetical protein